MFNPHSLSWPEITTLAAALGLVMNASIGFYLMKKSDFNRYPQPARARAKRKPLI
jgi:hypothetical protein